MHHVGKRGRGWSVPTEAARRNNRLKFAEVQIADRAQRLGGRAVLKVVRQAIQPGRELNLCFHEAGDVVGPAPGPAAMISRTADADDRYAGRARGAIAGLAFGVGHGCFTDRFARHISTPKRYVTIRGAGEDGSIAVLEAPAVIAGLDDVAMMRQAIQHGGGHPGSPNTCGQSAKARLVVISNEVFSYSLLIRWNSNWPPGWLNGR